MSPLVGPGIGFIGSINGSLRTTLFIGVFPRFETLKVYEIVSPGAKGVHPCGLFGLAIFSI